MGKPSKRILILADRIEHSQRPLHVRVNGNSLVITTPEQLERNSDFLCGCGFDLAILGGWTMAKLREHHIEAFHLLRPALVGAKIKEAGHA